MSPQTALVTGANRGIGLSFAKALAQAGWSVIAACRASSAELDALGVRVEPLDVTDPESVRALAERLDGTTVDLLINNAGVLNYGALGQLDYDAMLKQFQVNSMGPVRVTEALLGRLAPGARVAIVTSRMGSIEDNTSGGAYGYRMSKAAVNAAARSLALDLKPRGLAVGLLHPGWVKTDMTGGRGQVSADEAVAGMLQRIDELNLQTTGTFWHANGSRLPW